MCTCKCLCLIIFSKCLHNHKKTVGNIIFYQEQLGKKKKKRADSCLEIVFQCAWSYGENKGKYGQQQRIHTKHCQTEAMEGNTKRTREEEKGMEII